MAAMLVEHDLLAGREKLEMATVMNPAIARSYVCSWYSAPIACSLAISSNITTSERIICCCCCCCMRASMNSRDIVLCNRGQLALFG